MSLGVIGNFIEFSSAINSFHPGGLLGGKFKVQTVAEISAIDVIMKNVCSAVVIYVRYQHSK